MCALAVGDPEGNLFPLIGVAAFLGVGYRTPLAGVVFVAESTGRAGFVVPGLIASVATQLMMGGESVSPYQIRSDTPESPLETDATGAAPQVPQRNDTRVSEHDRQSDDRTGRDG